MDKVTDQVKTANYHSKAFDLYFGDQKLAVFDIETTGLYSARNRIMLTGILEVRPGLLHSTQFFAETPEEECEVLESTLDVLSRYDTILTYNGRRFDIPFFKKRMTINEFHDPEKLWLPDRLYNLDLFQIIRTYSGLKDVLPGLSQKDIEQYMGAAHSRTDRIDGSISITQYQKYQFSRDPKLKRQILLHNHDDILQLYRILPVIRNCDLHRALFSQGFPASDFLVKKISVTQGSLRVHCSCRTSQQDYCAFVSQDSPYAIRLSGAKNILEISFPLEETTGGLKILDIEKILSGLNSPKSNVTEALHSLPAFQSGYLIVQKNRNVQYAGINLFLKSFLAGLSGRLRELPKIQPLL